MTFRSKLCKSLIMLALLMKRSMSYTEALLVMSVRGFSISICHAAPHSGCQYVALVLVEFPQVMLKGVDCKVMLLFDPVLPFVSVLPSSELEPEFDPDPELELDPSFTKGFISEVSVNVNINIIIIDSMPCL